MSEKSPGWQYEREESRAPDWLKEVVSVEVQLARVRDAIDCCRSAIQSLSRPIEAAKVTPALVAPNKIEDINILPNKKKRSTFSFRLIIAIYIVVLALGICVAFFESSPAWVAISIFWPLLLILVIVTGLLSPTAYISEPPETAFFFWGLLIAVILTYFVGMDAYNRYWTHKQNNIGRDIAKKRAEEERCANETNAARTKRAEEANKNNALQTDKENARRKMQCEEFKKQLDGLTSCRDKIEARLSELYEEDILAVDYRNLGAVSCIFALLDSKVCYTLYGPDGAIAKFRRDQDFREIHQDLASISSNLEVIGQRVNVVADEIRKGNDEQKRLRFSIENFMTVSNNNTSYLIEQIERGNDLAETGLQYKEMSLRYEKEANEQRKAIKDLQEYQTQLNDYSNNRKATPPSRRYL